MPFSSRYAGFLSYPILELHIDDIRNLGYNPHSLNKDEKQIFIKHVINKLSDSQPVMDISLTITEVACDSMFLLPELRTEIDYLYKKYISEKGIEPLYAQSRLRNKNSNCGIRKETVKLKVEISSCDGNLINKYFDGHKRLREWLFSLKTDRREPDNWCYDDPTHTVVFSDTYIPTK